LTRKPAGSPAPREAGLRGLAATGYDRVEAALQHAFHELHRPTDLTKKADALRELVAGVPQTMPAGGTTDQRAKALWRLIQDEIRHIHSSDERTALIAAMHLDSANRASSIDKRLAAARDRGDFGAQPSGKPHGYDALRRWWGAGVRMLGEAVDERLDYLRHHPAGWQQYFGDTTRPVYRRASDGAQPVFAELFVTTVFMKGRFVHRRITERVITAQEDHVQYYTARAFARPTTHRPRFRSRQSGGAARNVYHPFPANPSSRGCGSRPRSCEGSSTTFRQRRRSAISSAPSVWRSMSRLIITASLLVGEPTPFPLAG